MGGVATLTDGWCEDPGGTGAVTITAYGQLDAVVTDDSLTKEVTADLVKEITGDVVKEITASVEMILTDDSLEAQIDE